MKRTYLTLIITMLVIGFAAISATLTINGTINFGFNQNEFKEGVVFTYKGTYNGEANISTDGKTINFTSVKLEDVNQKAILRYDIANKSNQYDASVTITCGFEDGFDSYKDWLDIKNDLESTFTLQAGKTKTGNLTVTLIKAYNENLEDDVDIKCEINASPAGREEKQEYVPVEHNYEEVLLQGADPVLEAKPVETVSLTAETSEKKLIPVTISQTGEVKKADITQKWYDYEHQEWANAVVLVDGATEPNVGSKIEEKDIESYFVWIPKYRYKLWNVGTDDSKQTGPFTIEIEFGTEDTKDNDNECIAPNISGEKNNCTNGKWMTHPAFTSFGVNGFWVGKFEVGYRQSEDLEDMSSWTKEKAKVNNEESSNVIVKPNVYSWRDITVKNMFYSLKNYATNLDSHMMKNTEWGAVVYLSHSKYGINDEVAQNTNPDYKTGYANKDSGYNSTEGFKASTTGNITGIYDMSGGAWEGMASYRDVENDTDKIGVIEFTKGEIVGIGKKYFDVYYKDTINTSYEKRILGDATGELGPHNNHQSSWYNDYAFFVEETFPWFNRGGHYTDGSGLAGQFDFRRNDGSINVGGSSRLVLSPQ